MLLGHRPCSRSCGPGSRVGSIVVSIRPPRTPVRLEKADSPKKGSLLGRERRDRRGVEDPLVGGIGKGVGTGVGKI